MKPLAVILPSLLSLAALGGVLVQQRRIAGLEARLGAPPPIAGDEAAPDPALGEVPLLRARLDRLERTLAAQQNVALAAPAANAPAAPAVEQLRADVDALLTGEATATPQGKARLKNLLDEAQREQQRERDQRRDERVLARLAETARMSDRQREDLGKAMESERAQRRTLIEAARAGQADYEQLRPVLDALRAETDRKAKEILDAEQFASYEASRARNAGPRNLGGGGAGAIGPGGPVSPAAGDRPAPR